MSIFPTPFSELFEIHGSKTKLHPVRYLSQACVSGISQTMFLFGICKDPFNGFFPCLVHPLVNRSVSGIVGHFFIFFPDVPGNGFHEIFAVCAKVSGGTVGTDFGIALVFPISVPVGGAIIQHLVFGANNTVKMLIVHIFPPFMAALHGLRPLVGCG